MKKTEFGDDLSEGVVLLAMVAEEANKVVQSMLATLPNKDWMLTDALFRSAPLSS